METGHAHPETMTAQPTPPPPGPLATTADPPSAFPTLHFDLVDLLLSATMRHLAGILRHDSHSELTTSVHACLTVTSPSTHLSRVALAILGAPSATSLAERGDVHALDLYARIGKLNDPESLCGQQVFWAAVAANQVAVMDWWTKQRTWRVTGNTTFKGLLIDEAQEMSTRSRKWADAPLSQAVEHGAVGSIAWLLENPDLVGDACMSKPPPARVLAGAMTDVCVAQLICAGHGQLAIRWIRSKYRIVLLDVDDTRNLCKKRKYALDHGHEEEDDDDDDTSDDAVEELVAVVPDEPEHRSGPSRLMQVIAARESIDVLSALVDGGEVYAEMLQSHGEFLVREAIQRPRVRLLKWWFENGQPWDLQVADLVAWVGDSKEPLVVLEMWQRKVADMSLNYDHVRGGNAIQVLDWMRTSGLKVTHSANAMDFASQRGNRAVLDWWRNTSGLQLKYTEVALDLAPDQHVLQWWYASGLPMRAKRALLDALAMGRRELVDWWMTHASAELLEVLTAEAWAYAFHHSGSIVLLHQCEFARLPVPDDPSIIDECLDVGALTWWSSRFNSLPFAYTERALAKASECGRVDLLDWWDQSGLELVYDASAMDLASGRGNVKVLEWWFLSGLEMEYTGAALDEASANGHLEVLTWWLDSGLELKYSAAATDDPARMGTYAKVIKWWSRSGLPIKSADD